MPASASLSRSPSRRSDAAAPTRRWMAVAAALLFSLLLGPSVARAQDAGTGVSSLTKDDFQIGFYRPTSEGGSVLAAQDLNRYFNQAGCLCQRPVRLRIFPLAGKAKLLTYQSTSRVVVAIGENCSSVTTGSFALCKVLRDTTVASIVANAESYDIEDVTVDLYSQHYGSSTNTVADGGTVSYCEKPEFTQTLWFMVDTGNDGNFDQSFTFAWYIDLNPPPVPSNLTARGGNEAIEVSWTPLTKADVGGDINWSYQVLCTRDSQHQVFDNAWQPQYLSPLVLKNNAKVTSCADPNTKSPILDYNPAFVCSDNLPSAASSHRIAILQNEIWYGASVVAIDYAGNPSALTSDDILYAQPTPSYDFFHEYRGETPPQGQARGGFCSVSPWTGGSLAGLGAALGLAGIVLVKRRRKS